MSPLVKQCIGTRHEPCTTLIPVGTKRCPKHALAEKRRQDPRRNTRPHRTIYNDPRWKRTRAIVIANPCALCGAQATIADHYPHPIMQCADPYDPANCRPLCHRCSGKADGQRSRTNHRQPTA